ncbi:MAG: biopolymer transporter ExbD [Elusimicrobia bacterium]|nr:biopolymer transporter ExbD [Elusimicrobiota bacterium]
MEDELPETTEIDVTPMATVALILVVIFMSSGGLYMSPTMKVELPQASTAESERKQNVTVSIGSNSEIAIDDVSVTWETLFDGLLLSLQNNKDKFVIIRADKNALYMDITDVMAWAKQAGAKSITIATEQKKK